MHGKHVTPNLAERANLRPQINANFALKAQPGFVFLACQHGAESKIKSTWAGPDRPFRLAFSRPGLLTFKIGEESLPILETENPTDLLVGMNNDVLIRQCGLAIGQLRGEDAEELLAQAIEQAGEEWDAVQVFGRDQDLPGSRGFEPGRSQVAESIAELFQSKLPSAHTGNSPCPVGSRVLDVVLVEPNQWILGCHRADAAYQCWPGGAFPVSIPDGMISRAYLKMAEALAWSQLSVQSGDRFVEIGSSPGGASQRLLDLGLEVTGVDPAEMDPLLLAHPRFEHWRSKSAAIKRKRYSKFRWLAADANVAPNYTLDAVEDIVTYSTSKFEGMLLTLKLSNYDLVDQLEENIARVKSWGFSRVEVRQLAYNRRECCLVAQR